MTKPLFFNTQYSLFPIWGYDDPVVLNAMQSMQKVPVPTRVSDVFNRTKMAWAKTLFSDQWNKDPTPGFGFGSIDTEYRFTIESYWVDKTLSSNITTDFIEEALGALEKKFNEDRGWEKKPFCERPHYPQRHHSFFIADDHFHWTKGDRFKEYNVSVRFILRVLLRLDEVLIAQLIKEFPPPSFKSEDERLQEVIVEDISSNYSPPVKKEFKSEENWKLASDYYQIFLDKRDQRMLKILKDNFAKDKEIRKTSPTASLVHLVSLESYEKNISYRRSLLYIKTTLVAMAIFFLPKFCRSSWSAQLDPFLLEKIFSLRKFFEGGAKWLLLEQQQTSNKRSRSILESDNRFALFLFSFLTQLGVIRFSIPLQLLHNLKI